MADPNNIKLPVLGEINRRTAIKATGATLGAAAFAKAMAPIVEWVSQETSAAEFLQQHFKELSEDDLSVVMRRLEDEAREEHGVEVTISDHRPQEGVKFGYALNLSICIGCRKCAEACHKENNHDRPSGNSYIRVLEMDKGSLDLESGNADYDHPVPQPDKFYMPVQCQQCEQPPCVNVCPVEALWWWTTTGA
jgi:ferredoxin